MAKPTPVKFTVACVLFHSCSFSWHQTAEHEPSIPHKKHHSVSYKFKSDIKRRFTASEKRGDYDNSSSTSSRDDDVCEKLTAAETSRLIEVPVSSTLLSIGMKSDTGGAWPSSATSGIWSPSKSAGSCSGCSRDAMTSLWSLGQCSDSQSKKGQCNLLQYCYYKQSKCSILLDKYMGENSIDYSPRLDDQDGISTTCSE